MTKRVLSVGQCVPDHGQLRSYIERTFAAQVVAADDADAALAALGDGTFDLVLVNRKLDADYSDGLEVIRRIKADPRHSALPCMLVTNLAEHQQAAIAAGCEPGFGKQQYARPETRERLARFLA
jgi:CheY-like chemotaxis protein